MVPVELLTWKPFWALLAYLLILAAAVRFIHFALFDGTLLTPYYYLIDFVVITLIAILGKRVTRARQMGRQYSFEYERRNALSWGRKG